MAGIIFTQYWNNYILHGFTGNNHHKVLNQLYISKLYTLKNEYKINTECFIEGTIKD